MSSFAVLYTTRTLQWVLTGVSRTCPKAPTFILRLFSQKEHQGFSAPGFHSTEGVSLCVFSVFKESERQFNSSVMKNYLSSLSKSCSAVMPAHICLLVPTGGLSLDGGFDSEP